MCEGALDAVRLTVNKIPAVAIGGNSISQEQSEFLASQPKDIVHWIDNDGAGRQGGERTVLVMNPLGVGVTLFCSDTAAWKDGDEAIGKIGSEAVISEIASKKVSAGKFLAERIASVGSRVKEGQRNKKARRIGRVLIGIDKDEFIEELDIVGVKMGCDISDALRCYANLHESGLSKEECQRVVLRRFEVTISVE